jgi:microcystin-dependent protein
MAQYDAFIGEIKLFAGDYAPVGWLFCQGQTLRNEGEFTALHSIIGFTYGGNGRELFQLPDLRGCVPLGAGAGSGLKERKLGERGGKEGVSLTYDQMPVHGHGVSTELSGTIFASLMGVAKQGEASTLAGSLLANNTNNFYRNSTELKAMHANSVSIDYKAFKVIASAEPCGGNREHENMPPFQAINYIICYDGLFPLRS